MKLDQWLDDLMRRVCSSCYQSLTDRRWFQDRPRILNALTSPAHLARTFNWDLTLEGIQRITRKAVEDLEKYQEDCKSRGQTIKYPPAFLARVAATSVKMESDKWKQRPAGIDYDQATKSIKINEVDVLAEMHEQLASRARKAVDLSAPQKPKGKFYEAEQFEMKI